VRRRVDPSQRRAWITASGQVLVWPAITVVWLVPPPSVVGYYVSVHRPGPALAIPSFPRPTPSWYNPFLAALAQPEQADTLDIQVQLEVQVQHVFDHATAGPTGTTSNDAMVDASGSAIASAPLRLAVMVPAAAVLRRQQNPTSESAVHSLAERLPNARDPVLSGR
jgi:hypothetical protein